MDFRVGDIVWLRSGGPAMTVQTVHDAAREVRCVWTVVVNGAPRAQKDILHFESLTKTDPAGMASSPVPLVRADGIYEEGDD